MTYRESIRQCCFKIENKFGHGPSSEWSHHHFKLLSEEIEKETGEYISETTLKRLYGKRITDSDYLPQLATRDALARYAGFENWHNLCQNPYLSGSKERKKIPGAFAGRKISKIIFPGIMFFLSLGIIIMLFVLSNRNRIGDFSLNIRNPIDTVPFTAVFDYQIPPKLKDSISLYIPGHGISKLRSDKNIYTVWFYFAGYFKIPVYYGTRIIDTLIIEAINNKWQPGLFKEDTTMLFDPFLESVVKAKNNGMLYIPPALLHNAGIDSLSRYMLEFRLFRDFKIILDECTISTIARNNQETGGKPCYDIDIELIGEYGDVRTVFTDKKCSRFVQLVISDVEYNGRNYDLSMFSTNIDRWRVFKTEIYDYAASISIDNNIIFKQEYNREIGKLKGIIIRFFGSGQVQSIEIQDKSGKKLFYDDFLNTI